MSDIRTTLVNFLEARFEEDEWPARRKLGLYRFEEYIAGQKSLRLRHANINVEEWSNSNYSEGGVLLIPERWLDEIAAKREIVEHEKKVWESGPKNTGIDTPILRYLAWPYSHHPDFDPEWSELRDY